MCTLNSNLFALDYLKDHDVTREQFESVWETLDDDIHQVIFPLLLL
jgi:hypothetical protein